MLALNAVIESWLAITGLSVPSGMTEFTAGKQTLNDCLGLNMLLPISFEYAAEQSGANIPYNCTPHTNSVWQ